MIRIQLAGENHISELAAIEKAAAERFAEIDLPPSLRSVTISIQQHREAQKQGLLLVALNEADEPVGFAINTLNGVYLHLLEMDVSPRYQRRGIGRSLLEKVTELAVSRNCGAVTLSTYKYVEWNAPWYEKNGFEILMGNDIPPFLQKILAEEKARGLNRNRRVAMCKRLD